MSSNTLGEIVEFVRDDIREPVVGFFSQDEIMRSINLIQLEMARDGWATLRTDTLTLDAGRKSADLPVDYLAVNKVYSEDLDGGTKIIERRGIKGRQATSLLGPGYYLEGTKIFFTDAQDSTNSTKLSLVFKPFEFADFVTDEGTESSVPQEFIIDLVEGVSARSLYKKRDVPEADRKKRNYINALPEMKKYQRERDGKIVLNIEK